jgi:hypothetical protein
VDTPSQLHQVGAPIRKNRWRTKAERRAIVEETLLPDASVSRVARRHDVNTNSLLQVAGCQVCVAHGHFDVLVAHQFLDGVDVYSAHHQTGTIRMTVAVPDVVLDLGFF